MQNNFITKISQNLRIIILILIILNLFLAKSIYLILFITTLTFIFFIITDKKTNLCVNILKKIIILLLIFLVGYIIVLRYYNLNFVILLLYKLAITIILIEIFLFNTSFNELHNGLYTVFLPLKRFNVDVEQMSFNVTLVIYFFEFFYESREKIINAQVTRGKKTISLINFIFPCIICSINELEKLQENLKIKFYKLNRKSADLRSKAILILFLLFFVICVFKEVIL